MVLWVVLGLVALFVLFELTPIGELIWSARPQRQPARIPPHHRAIQRLDSQSGR